jgi:hypothetical protein
MVCPETYLLDLVFDSQIQLDGVDEVQYFLTVELLDSQAMVLIIAPYMDLIVPA